MSLPFNDTTGKGGIIQGIETECGFNDGDISGNSLRLKKFTAGVNQSLDEAFAIIFKADGKCRFDDKNHDDYNIIYFDIVAGQRDYSFINDENGNLILSVDKVYRRESSTGPYEPIDPIDPVTEPGADQSLTNGLNVTGIPSAYDKTANGILFDVVPNYSADEGGMMYISREASYFTTSDTTKKPGFDGLYHRWCVVSPSLEYARIHLPQNRVNMLQLEKNALAQALKDCYGLKQRDEKDFVRPRITEFR